MKVNRLTRVVLMLFCMLAPGFLVENAYAQREFGYVAGSVRDIETGDPIGWTQLLLEEVDRSISTGQDGRFMLRDVPPGVLTLNAYRIGYESLSRSIEITAGDTLVLILEMAVSPIESEGILVESEGVEQLRVEQELAGASLRQQLGTTIAETLKDEPGIAMRSMGPAPARPVLRGMGGDRLLVLEDGERTGDLSATSSDHAVVIEPINAQRIEVYRGPEALLYGSSTLGGVVNVVRGYIPSSMPEYVQGGLSGQVESVNRGYASSILLEVPVGPLSVRLDGSYRQSQDTRTPLGMLENTSIETYSPSIGVNFIKPQYSLGGAFAYYHSEYGIPGGFIGAHPGGVTVRLDRRHYETQGSLLPESRWIRRVEAKGTYSRYFHQEFESSGSLGVEFGVLAYHGSLVAHTRPFGPFSKGAVGVWTEYRDYASNGLVFTPTAVERTVAGFGYQEMALGPVLLQAGLRLDLRQIKPEEEHQSDIGFIRERSFSGFSASVRGEVELTERLRGEASIVRSLRMPSLEELYSEGPHLAAYSYEVGDPDLSSERGWGVEAALNYASPRASASFNVFHNEFDGYIFPRNTGRLNVRLLLPTFQTTGAAARLYGAEFSGLIRLNRRFTLSGQSSYVHGTLVDTGEPLPWMPPLSWKASLEYRLKSMELGISTRGAISQDRLGAFEEHTDGYEVVDVHLQYFFPTGRFFHTINFAVQNLTNAEFRDHLSRVKSIMPEPGINVKLLYKAYF